MSDAVSERIYADLDIDFIRRMRNWARYKDGAHVSTTPLEYVGSEFRVSPVPILFGEAEDTDIALRHLRHVVRVCVEQWWRNESRSLRWHGRKLQISYHTFESRVVIGHRDLRAELRRMRLAILRRRESLTKG
jgi:hypothetical protein